MREILLGAMAAPTANQLENARKVEQGQAAFNRGDIEAALELADEHLEWHPAFGEALLGASTYAGFDGFRRYAQQTGEVIADFRMEPEHIDVWGDEYVVVAGRFSGRGRESGMDLSTDMTVVWRLCNGMGVWGATYFQRADALAAIGAKEDELLRIK